jgi:hypothetical protein
MTKVLTGIQLLRIELRLGKVAEGSWKVVCAEMTRLYWLRAIVWSLKRS